MNQQDFEQRHRESWNRLDTVINALSNKKIAIDDATRSQFPNLYRQVCHHLAIARERQYTSHLIDYLNQLMLRGHQYLYSVRAGNMTQIMRFLGGGFSNLIRQEWRMIWLSTALFYLPFIIMGVAVYFWPQMIFTIFDYHEVMQFDYMYSPDAPHIGRQRDAGDDMFMFGMYIQHNISIGFQTFAGGILFGLGSIFFLIYNGLFIGAVAGYLTQRGYVDTFWSFVIGHGAFELTAIVFSGAAGLKIGLALLSPGRKTRTRSVADAARISIRIIYGVIGMLVIAAFLEAFWSSLALVSPMTKYIVGGCLWTLVIYYFVLFGRGQRAD